MVCSGISLGLYLVSKQSPCLMSQSALLTFYSYCRLLKSSIKYTNLNLLTFGNLTFKSIYLFQVCQAHRARLWGLTASLLWAPSTRQLATPHLEPLCHPPPPTPGVTPPLTRSHTSTFWMTPVTSLLPTATPLAPSTVTTTQWWVSLTIKNNTQITVMQKSRLSTPNSGISFLGWGRHINQMYEYSVEVLSITNVDYTVKATVPSLHCNIDLLMLITSD